MFTRFSAIGAVVALLLVGNACADGRVQLLATDPAPLVADTASGPVAFSIEIADDAGERERGLMFRDDLPENHGMLFVFERPERLSFWMRNTFIPLSIAFIAADGRIVNIEDMAPQTETSHWSRGPALYALEMRRGWFAERGIRDGDAVEGLPVRATAR